MVILIQRTRSNLWKYLNKKTNGIKVVKCDSNGNTLFGSSNHNHSSLSFSSSIFFLSDKFKRLGETVKTTFLPKDYPNSVHANYANFSGWNFMQSALGSMTGVISTQCLLYGLGMTSVASSTGGTGAIVTTLAMSTTLNWILKDGIGHFGGIIFVALASGRFDLEPKKFRFLAAIMLKFAMLLEILVPLKPKFFLLLASIANIGKNIAWMGTSATRAQIHRHLAMMDNMGDLSAKASSQNTLASLIGSGLGILISIFYAIPANKDDQKDKKDKNHNIDNQEHQNQNQNNDNVKRMITKCLQVFIPISMVAIWASYQSCKWIISPRLTFHRFNTISQMILKDIKVKMEKSPLKIFPNSPSTIHFPFTIIDLPTPELITKNEGFLLSSHSREKNSILLEPLIDNIQNVKFFNYSNHSFNRINTENDNQTNSDNQNENGTNSIDNNGNINSNGIDDINISDNGNDKHFSSSISFPSISNRLQNDGYLIGRFDCKLSIWFHPQATNEQVIKGLITINYLNIFPNEQKDSFMEIIIQNLHEIFKRELKSRRWNDIVDLGHHRRPINVLNEIE